MKKTDHFDTEYCKISVSIVTYNRKTDIINYFLANDIMNYFAANKGTVKLNFSSKFIIVKLVHF